MANIYVSQTAINGYAVGDDARTKANAASKTTPVLTVTRALAVAEANDIIIINDGTYTEASFISNADENLTINAENDYQVIIRSASGTVRVVYVASTGLTLGKIVIDAQNTQQNCINGVTTSNIAKLTLSGTKLINFTMNGISFAKLVNLTMNNGWEITSSSTVQHGIYLSVPDVSTVSIENGTIDLELTATGTMRGILALTATAGSVLNINNIDMKIASTSATSTVVGISSSGFATNEIYDNTITGMDLAATNVISGISVPNSTILCNKCWVYDNVIDGGNTAIVSGASIVIGDDADVQPTYFNAINGAWVKNNTCKNINHGILCGWVIKGVVQGNSIENTVIGVISKQSTDCLFTGNIIKMGSAGTGGALRMKYGSGAIFNNNTVIIIGTLGLPIYLTHASTGGVFKNNMVYCYGVTSLLIQVDAECAATFENNNYYSSLAIGTFLYNAVSYTLSQWIAANESTALNIDPDFISYPTDLRIPASNTDLYHKGKYAGVNARDYKGRSFFVKPTIGAYEVSNGDRCVARQPRI